MLDGIPMDFPIFQSSRPIRGETLCKAVSGSVPRISILSPRAGRDRQSCKVPDPSTDFNPLAPCGARQTAKVYVVALQTISILSPRAGRDVSCGSQRKQDLYFNPLAPCGARHAVEIENNYGDLFQSTRPVRGETDAICESYERPAVFQSTRPVRGETLPGDLVDPVALISIHSPRAERDTTAFSVLSSIDLFQSTRPVRGETWPSALKLYVSQSFQSSRSVRGETCIQSKLPTPQMDFNPLAPCGARLAPIPRPTRGIAFQSSRPVRGETL